MDPFFVFFGHDKIFIIIRISSIKIIEIGCLNDKNLFQPIMFFNHKSSSELDLNIQLLLSTGFDDYQKYYLMFNEDYISPIFEQNNNRIGQAFRYEESINDYSKYIYREENMKLLMQIYFSNYKLKTKFIKEIEKDSYYIINENYLNEIGSYSLIENELKKLI